MFIELKRDFTQRFDQLDNQIHRVDEKFNKKFDQLFHKLDDVYERSATSIIIDRIQVDHQVEIPSTPTNRIFHANYSEKCKIFFNHFGKIVDRNYANLWKNKYKSVAVSLKPQQIEFDILGFAYEHAYKERSFITSPNIELIYVSSSNTHQRPNRTDFFWSGSVRFSRLKSGSSSVRLVYIQFSSVRLECILKKSGSSSVRIGLFSVSGVNGDQ